MVLALDEIIVTETPPLFACYGKRGHQVCVPITGNRSKRIIHGVINIKTGEVLLLMTNEWNQDTHQYFLTMIRRHWRGWNIVLFEDRGSPHVAEDSLELADELAIEVRLLPRACPELNPMDHLFRFVKGRALANRPTKTIDDSAQSACDFIFKLNREERLTKAGILSPRFWLSF